jgi:glutamate racemase
MTKNSNINTSPIGVFDSGVGGTSIWKEIHDLLPGENTIYLADSKNAPYGVKSKQAIIDLSVKNTELLLKENCKIIVVACNTATTNAIDHLREHYSVPFIGIEPAIKPASLNTQSKAIGILATKGTLSSKLFHRTAEIYGKGICIIEQEGTGIVELIEGGRLHSEEMKTLLSSYLQPMIDANIDHLVLGCSHYPYLIPVLRNLLPTGVKIIDSGLAVARQTRTILENLKLFNQSGEPSSHLFYTNDDPAVLKLLIGTNYLVNRKNF